MTWLEQEQCELIEEYFRPLEPDIHLVLQNCLLSNVFSFVSFLLFCVCVSISVVYLYYIQCVLMDVRGSLTLKWVRIDFKNCRFGGGKKTKKRRNITAL